jgi:AcrR family transcriptional regulator
MMPPQNIFTREMFIEAAFKVARAKGIEKLSARSLAHELHCSTMPIYSYLKSMKKLKEDLEKKSVDLLLSYQTTRRTDSPFLDMGLGYVLFARNEKHLFRFLFLSSEKDSRHNRGNKNLRQLVMSNLLPGMKDDPVLEGLDAAQAEMILLKMWIFTHGIAFLANSNALPNDDEKYIEELIHDTGRAVIMDAFNVYEDNMEVHYESTGAKLKPAGGGAKQDGADAVTPGQRHAGRGRRSRNS